MDASVLVIVNCYTTPVQRDCFHCLYRINIMEGGSSPGGRRGIWMQNIGKEPVGLSWTN
ncbi:UNVERIFIED_CONTAM: hypothetical protein FKN15_058096 [Acipenser sinensis]